MHLFLSCFFARAIISICGRESALVRGFASRCSVVGARGGKEAALHLERRGGEPSRPCLPIPPKELNVKSNVDCIRMQPSIRWSIV